MFRAITTDASNSPLSKDILGCEFLKKFTIPTFDCYFDHLRQYQEKMMIHVINDSILCRIIPSSLKEVALIASTIFRQDQFTISRISPSCSSLSTPPARSLNRTTIISSL